MKRQSDKGIAYPVIGNRKKNLRWEIIEGTEHAAYLLAFVIAM